jgi:hypothetical protein
VCLGGVTVCYYVVGFYIVYVIAYVCIVGVIVAYVLLAICVSGFYPPYYRIYYYFYLIFVFWANIFRSAFPWDSDVLCVSLIVVRAYYNSTYLISISSTDSFASAAFFRSCGPNVG